MRFEKPIESMYLYRRIKYSSYFCSMFCYLFNNNIVKLNFKGAPDVRINGREISNVL